MSEIERNKYLNYIAKGQTEIRNALSTCNEIIIENTIIYMLLSKNFRIIYGRDYYKYFSINSRRSSYICHFTYS